MIILQPVVHETIWGGSKLTKYSGTDNKRIGHLYSLYSSRNNDNLILNGTLKGTSFNEWFSCNKGKYGLKKYDYFPLVIALVEAADNLSIQVHPDDATAPILDSEIKLGKCESWFFIDAPKNGKIYDGCTCKTMDELKDAINSGNTEDVTDLLEVKKGDYVHVEAGTLHAMSTGSLVYEIEENAGCTYRFYDFDRIDINGQKRPLQIPEAFYSVDIDKKSVARRYEEGKPIIERKYLTQYFDSLGCYINHGDTLQIMTVLDGTFAIEGIEVITGMSIVMEPNDELDFYGSKVIMAQPLNL